MPRILVILAHPDLAQSRVAKAVMVAAQAAAQAPTQAEAADDGVELLDLYARYPDYLIDGPAERQRLAQVRLLVWVHPFHWYAMPPLMKLWLDQVLSFGWAYGPGGDALRGRDLWLVTSTGGPQDSYHPAGYNRYAFDAFLPPYEQTATLVGMRFLPPLVLYGAHRASDAEIADHATEFALRLRQYPHWPELDRLANYPDCAACAVPGDARPVALDV